MNLLTNKVQKIDYRPDIDGLRAIAVIIVLFFHLEIPFFSGGFVGVDIFFVITGFFFGYAVLEPISKNEFSIRSYYEKRVKRLAPAFLLVSTLTSLLAYYFLLPLDLIAFWKTLKAALLFHSNIHFSNQAGYFDSSASLKPILHFWSLSIEYQFYLVFPLIALISFRFLNSFLFIWLALIVSFLLSIYWINTKPNDAYFLLQFRAWEILFGTSIYALCMKNKNSKKPLSKMYSYIGLFLISISVVSFNKHLPFPGFRALVPLIGGGLLIYSGYQNEENLILRALKFRPLVFIGKISYSLYLWHWPLIVFLLYYLDHDLSGFFKIIVILVSLFLAYVTYRFIEIPFRQKIFINAFGPLILTILVIFAILLSPSLFGKGYEYRLSRESLVFNNARTDWNEYQTSCADKVEYRISRNSLCTFYFGQHKAPNILIWGDSHATALLPVIYSISSKQGYTVKLATTNGCPPIIGIKTDKAECLKANDAVINMITKNNFDIIILAANWNSYGEDNYISVKKDELKLPLINTIHFIKKNTAAAIIIAGQIPRYKIEIPNYLAKNSFMSDADNFFSYHRPIPKSINEAQYFHEAMSEVSNLNIFKIYPKDFICSDFNCSLELNGRSLYKDGGHLSTSGSMILFPIFDQEIKKALKQNSKR